MKNIFGIVGWSGSGKTHLICRIIQYFNNKKLNVCSIKHSHHNFEIDKKGKDSHKHLTSGSKEVVIYNDLPAYPPAALVLQVIGMFTVLPLYLNDILKD